MYRVSSVLGLKLRVQYWKGQMVWMRRVLLCVVSYVQFAFVIPSKARPSKTAGQGELEDVRDSKE